MSNLSLSNDKHLSNNFISASSFVTTIVDIALF